jgi:hypothetical protein
MQAEPPERRPPARTDPAAMRISDEDRHKVAEVLRNAAGEGRIDLDELEERLEATFHAKTYGELVPITVDLPVAGQPFPLPSPAAPRRMPSLGPPVRYGSSLAVMSETKRTGSWLVEDGTSAFALMGSVLLDMREAQFGAREVTVMASAVMGDVTVLVNAATRVVVEGVGVMGEYTERRSRVPADADPHAPVLRLRGIALMGSVSVQRKGPPGQGRRALRR